MDDSQERLIEATVRPISYNAEMRHAAADFIGKRIAAKAWLFGERGVF
jgi:hypothetical protein